MAVTGSGIQADPYICETWEDLVGVQGDEVYITMSDNGDPVSGEKIIDFNIINPEITDPIQLKGYIDFNNWTIRNMNFKTTGYCIHVGRNTWSNLFIDNLIAEINDGSYNCIFYTESNYSHNVKFTNVKIKGEVTFIKGNTNRSVYIFNGGGNSGNGSFDGCGLKILINTPSSGSGDRIIIIGQKNIIDSFFSIETKQQVPVCLSDVNSNSSLYISGNYVTGVILGDFYDIPFSSSATTQPIYNIYNISTQNGVTHFNQGICIFNSDTAPNAQSSTFLKGVSSEEMRNPAYLRSIGFPCYGEIVND